MRSPMEQQDRKWSRAGLRIASKTLDPSKIGEMLGLEPTKMHVKGTPRSSRHTAVWPASMWSLESPLSDSLALTDHLRFLLDLLEPKKGVLKQLSMDCDIDVFCGFSSGSGQGGFILDSATLSRLGALGLPLVLDLYPPGPIENETNDSGE